VGFSAAGFDGEDYSEDCAWHFSRAGHRTLNLSFDGDFRFAKIDFGKLVVFQGKQIEQYGDRRPHDSTSKSCFSSIPSTQAAGRLAGFSVAKFPECLTAVREFMRIRK
jgi:hypothetical protein